MSPEVVWIGAALALDYKTAHFAAEREWRCIVERPFASAPPRVRVSANALHSYVPLPVQVKTIKAGPRAEPRAHLADPH